MTLKYEDRILDNASGTVKSCLVTLENILSDAGNKPLEIDELERMEHAWMNICYALRFTAKHSEHSDEDSTSPQNGHSEKDMLVKIVGLLEEIRDSGLSNGAKNDAQPVAPISAK